MRFLRLLSLGIAGVLVLSTSLLAHPRTTTGTVASAEPTKIVVSTTDAKTRKTVSMSFEIDKDTKIFRGAAAVTFDAAKIQKGERVSVTVDLDNADDLADVIKLAVRKIP